MVFSRSYLGWLFLISTTVPTAAQYRFDHWTTDNGLPQNSVRDILKTRDGYLWFTTFDGLVRFDGVHFTVFNKGNSPGIASNRFVKLFEDRQGDLWAMLDTGETVRRHQGRFTTYSTNPELLGGLIPLLGDDGQGNVVIYYIQIKIDKRDSAYIGATLRAIRWANDRFQPADDLNVTYSMPRLSVKEANSFSSQEIGGNFWVTTERRVIRLKKGGAYEIYDGFPGKDPILVWTKQLTLKAITREATGRLWLTDLPSGQSELLSQSTPDDFKIHEAYADDEGNLLVQHLRQWFVSSSPTSSHALW